MTHPFDPPRGAGCLRLLLAVLAAAAVLSGLLIGVDAITRGTDAGAQAEVQR